MEKMQTKRDDRPNAYKKLAKAMGDFADAFERSAKAIDAFAKAWRKAERQRKRHEWWGHYRRPWNRVCGFFARAWKWLVEREDK